MGNKSLKNLDVTDYDPTQWKVIGYHQQNAQIVLNQISKLQAQSKIIFLDPKLNLQNQIQIYQYRKNQTNSLVKCIAVSIEQQKNKSLCGTGTAIKVLTQRIPLRFNQLPQLTFQETLYTLSESLKGFQECFKRLGAFEITDDMIGVNTEGQIKVWVNPDFAENHPLTEKPYLHTSGTVNKQQLGVQNFIVKEDQVDLMENIRKIIDKKCQLGKFPLSFSNEIKKRIGFDQTFDLIEKYSKKNKIFIPDRIINIETSNLKKPIHFTPGVQYQRDQNDPLYRRQVQFPPQLKSQNIQNNEEILQYQNIVSPKSKNVKKVQSPIIQLYQSYNPPEQQQEITIGKSSNQFKNLKGISQISPVTSTLVFNNQSCIRPHQLGKYKI